MVKENENGVLFSNANELADHLRDLLEESEEARDKLELFRRNLEEFTNWNEEWSLRVEPELNFI